MLGAKSHSQRGEFWTFLALSFECDEASAKERGRAASGWTKEARATSQGTMPMAMHYQMLCSAWLFQAATTSKTYMWDLLSSAPLRNAICDSDVAICHSFRTYLSSPGKVSFCGMLTTIFFSRVSVYWPCRWCRISSSSVALWWMAWSCKATHESHRSKSMYEAWRKQGRKGGKGASKEWLIAGMWEWMNERVEMRWIVWHDLIGWNEMDWNRCISERQMNGWTNGCMGEWMRKSFKDWMSEWVNQFKTEWMDVWMAWHKQKELINESLNWNEIKPMKDIKWA